MGTWTYARIDRIESGVVHCAFCNRGLRSGRVIVICDELGKEAYAGPACAKKHVGTPTEQILDLSRMAMLIVLKGEEVRSQAVGAALKDEAPTTTQPRVVLEVDEAVNYLRLRAEHMPGFAGNATQRLREIHEQLSTDEGLSDSARLYVERLIAKSRADNSIYSIRNVERCIGAAHWLKVAIEHTKPDRREFLEKMHKSLLDHWRLSTKQIEGVNKWGEGVRKQLADFPVLDTMTFEGVQTPRFASNQKSGS